MPAYRKTATPEVWAQRRERWAKWKAEQLQQNSLEGRLARLHEKLEDEGRYTDSNTVWLAIQSLTEAEPTWTR